MVDEDGWLLISTRLTVNSTQSAADGVTEFSLPIVSEMLDPVPNM